MNKQAYERCVGAVLSKKAEDEHVWAGDFVHEDPSKYGDASFYAPQPDINPYIDNDGAFRYWRTPKHERGFTTPWYQDVISNGRLFRGRSGKYSDTVRVDPNFSDDPRYFRYMDRNGRYHTGTGRNSMPRAKYFITPRPSVVALHLDPAQRREYFRRVQEHNQRVADSTRND